MLFNSFNFIILLTVTFVLFYLPILYKYQTKILIFSSLTFYAFNNLNLLILLLTSVFINSITSYYVINGKKKNQKITASIGVISNLSILAFFKYSSLIAITFLPKSNSIGEFLINIPLPVGISFFTFQGISLVIDVYRNKENKSVNNVLVPKKYSSHFEKTLFFITFFPQLVAGPIVKAHDFLPQIHLKTFKNINWELCVKNLILGYFLKVVIADNLKEFTFWIEYPYFEGQASVTLIIMLLGYSAQIFADFAGYSLIAIGLGYLFGYTFMDNFNFPYISRSFKEFWKRWHISLSSFLMEYLYIPLGGNKNGKLKMYRNLMITMFLGGLWHGAAWSYAIWGIYHGLLLILERLINEKLPKSKFEFIILKRIFIFTCITLGWLLFKLPNFADVIKYLNCIYTNIDVHLNWQICINTIIYASPIYIYHLVHLNKYARAYAQKVEPILYGILLFLIFTNSGISGSFIYFQF